MACRASGGGHSEKPGIRAQPECARRWVLPTKRPGEALPRWQPAEDDDARLPRDWYTTDLWTTFGLKFIDEAALAKKPFFLYLAHNAPHFPLQAPEDAIAKFRGKYKAGWDALRPQRQRKQVELGLIDPA